MLDIFMHLNPSSVQKYQSFKSTKLSVLEFRMDFLEGQDIKS